MDITAFKELVAAYMLRDVEYFTQDNEGNPGVDKLLLATNNAKVYIQRQLDFYLARCAVSVTHTTTGANLSTAVLLDDGVTPVLIKKPVTTFLASQYDAHLPLRMATKKAIDDRIRDSRDKGTFPACGDSSLYGFGGDPIAYQFANKIHLYPKPTVSTALVLDVVRWMPAYVDTGGSPVTTDFIMEFCTDYLMYRTISELNFYLKDDERVAISAAKMQDAFQSVQVWNDGIETGNEDLD